MFKDRSALIDSQMSNAFILASTATRTPIRSAYNLLWCRRARPLRQWNRCLIGFNLSWPIIYIYFTPGFARMKHFGSIIINAQNFINIRKSGRAFIRSGGKFWNMNLNRYSFTGINIYSEFSVRE